MNSNKKEETSVLKEELHFKPNQVEVIRAIVVIREESIAECLQRLIISMVDCDLNDPRMCAENFCNKWKKVWNNGKEQ